MKQESYSVYEAKARLSEILRKVRRNQKVIITLRGKPVAEIVPVRGEPQSLEEHLEGMEEAGLASGSSGSLADIAPLASRPGALKRFLDERGD